MKEREIAMKKTFTEDELEEAGEEEQLQPEGGTKKRSAEAQSHDIDAAANSDEDLPEVFSMTEGKSMVQQLRNEEKASGRRIAAEVKKKKQERAANRKNEKASGKLGLSPQEELTAGIDDADPKQLNVNGRLDDTIVQFLSAREKAELDEAKLVSSPQAEVVKVKRLKSRKEKNNSRVQVVDLSRNSSFIEERNALEFKQRELYGNRIKRDPSMLRSLTRVP